MIISDARLVGRDEDGLLECAPGQRLAVPAAEALALLQRDAREAGFELAVASAFRSFDRQLQIFNAKASGERPVHDAAGRTLDIGSLSESQRLHAILRFSALPGTSRHHWGTDLDVYDARALPEGYRLQLSPAEVAPGGMFDGLHRWLDQRMADDASHGFYRPYAADHGGVAPERWHLSYAPLASSCERRLTPAALRAAWSGVELALRERVEEELEAIFDRYVSVPQDWCPAG